MHLLVKSIFQRTEVIKIQLQHLQNKACFITNNRKQIWHILPSLKLNLGITEKWSYVIYVLYMIIFLIINYDYMIMICIMIIVIMIFD